MRTAVVFLMLVLASCSAGVTDPDPVLVGPRSRVSPPPLELPALEDLDRLASEAQVDGQGGECTLVSQSSTGVDAGEIGWDIEPAFPEQVAWAVLSCGPWKQPSENMRYLSANLHRVSSPEGTTYFGVADWERGRWIWQAVPEQGSLSLPEWSPLKMFDLSQVGNPVSPAGNVYTALVAWGDGSLVRANLNLGLQLEFDEPYLEPPVITEMQWDGGTVKFKYDPGPDAGLLNSTDLQIYRCEGQVFDPATATASWLGSLPGGWQSAGVPGDVTKDWTYSMRLESGNINPGLPQPGKWSDPFTVAGQV